MSTRTRKLLTVIAATTALVVGLACEHGEGLQNPAEEAQERERERSGALPGRRIVIEVDADSDRRGFTIELLRIDYHGEEYHRIIEETTDHRHLFLDARSDDQSYVATVYKSDAPDNNLVSCEIQQAGEPPLPREVAAGKDPAICIWYGMWGAGEPEA